MRRAHRDWIAVAAVLGLLLPALAVAASKTARGHFTSIPVTGPECLSPVGICTQGTLSGGLKGSFVFTGTALVPTADTPATSVVLYTGDIQIQTPGGDLTCKDAGAFQTTGDGAVSSVCSVVAGTGELAGATGTIQFVGTFTFATGGQGEYRAVLDVP